jgi:hypothetical protein
MKMRRLALGLVLLAAAGLAAALPAAAKEGVKATLESTIPLDASPGTKLDVRWSLASRDEHGRRQPFGAGMVFVRLFGEPGSAPKTAYTHGGGTFEATVVVPDGGIRDVQIGLRGFTSGANGTRNADMIFPITNDPLPGAARVTSSPSGTDWERWILVAIFGGAVIAVACFGVAFARRRSPSVLSRG